MDLVADLTVINPFDFFVEPYAEMYPFAYSPSLAKELIPFLEVAPAAPRLANWIAAFRSTIRSDESTVNLLVRLNQQLQLLSLAFPLKMLTALLVLSWIAAVFPRLLLEFSGHAWTTARRAIGL